MIDSRRHQKPRPERHDASPKAHRLDLGGRLHRLGVSADAVTVAGVVVSLGAGIAIGFGQLYVGVLLLIVGGLMDFLDGIVAKAAGKSSVRGAFVDSVSDRVSDAFILLGVTWYLIDHDPRAALVPVAILAVSSIISYERAKAESLGLSGKGGLMERAERQIVLGAALLFHIVLVPLLLCLLVLSTLTAIGRFGRIWRRAGGKPTPAPGRILVGVGRVETRFRTWRATGRTGAERRRSRTRRQARPLSERFSGMLRGEHGRPVGANRHTSANRAAQALRRRLNDSVERRS